MNTINKGTLQSDTGANNKKYIERGALMKYNIWCRAFFYSANETVALKYYVEGTL